MEDHSIQKINTGFYSLAIHGGVGSIQALLTKIDASAFHNALHDALKIGNKILQNGGASLEAVEKTIMALEDSPLFNAGKGSVLCHDGTIQMDASIMDGNTLNAGAVAGIRRIKNPISAAKMILKNAQYVFLHGEGAEKYYTENGGELVDTPYFFTQMRWEQLQNALKKDNKMSLDHGDDETKEENDDHKFGTVGCVALDMAGNLSAGTSTGGLVNKKYHRIGDSPIIGSGTYAENGICAVSCTGRGEQIMKHIIAYDIAAQIKYGSRSFREAVNHTIQKNLSSTEGRGGCVAMDHNGHIIFDFTTSGMFRGFVDADGCIKTAIHP